MMVQDQNLPHGNSREYETSEKKMVDQATENLIIQLRLILKKEIYLTATEIAERLNVTRTRVHIIILRHCSDSIERIWMRKKNKGKNYVYFLLENKEIVIKNTEA